MTDRTKPAPTPTPEELITRAATFPAAAPKITPGGATICDTPEAIERFRMIACLQGLSLEAKGIRIHRGLSCLKVARRDYGIRAANAATAYERMRALMISRGIIAADAGK